eukprot:1396506-Rhodomonas_salina.1
MVDVRQPSWRPHVECGADLSDPKRRGRERCSPGAGQSTVARTKRLSASMVREMLSPMPSRVERCSDWVPLGLMTLVIKGNKSYFEQAGSLDYAVNLEDAIHLPEGARNLLCAVGSNIAHAVSKVISIHIMEPGSVRFDAVKALVEQPGEDNTLSSGLDRDGHFVDGAFRFTVDAARQRAYFAPSDALLDLCSFNPPRPSTSVPFPVTR